MVSKVYRALAAASLLRVALLTQAQARLFKQMVIQ